MIREDHVIDNKEVILKEELLRILPKTKNASIAVGYFFISGMAAIIDSLKGVDKIRLLISNTTDQTTAEALIEVFYSIDEIRSKMDEQNFINTSKQNKIISDSKDNVKHSLEYMNQTSSDKAVVEALIEMMKSGRIEVKVYQKEKLHAKAYIFQSRDTDVVQGVGIVGSSNLSLAGISHNSELNLKTYHTADINRLLEWFDRMWDDGIKFTEDFRLILENSWAGKTHSPYELFLKASYLEYKDRLEEQHEIDPVLGTTFPKLFEFQKNAVDQGLTMFESYGGVIIGDVVGLGKTYVGTTLLKYLQLHKYRPMIVCPPHLVEMWEKFCEDYEVDAKVLSRGKLSQKDFELYLDYRYKSRDLVLIDESHHFRNSGTRQYDNLQQFMHAREAKAILLTATPFSNKETDIKNQIMLFHHTSKTSIPPANETDLDVYFSQVNKGTADLVDLLRNIMVRRTRRFVINHWGKEDENGRKYLQVGDERKYFPERKMITERYDINKVYQQKYEAIISHLSKEHLTFARYSLGLYLKEGYKNIELYKDLGEAGKNLVGLIRTILMKRMESSQEAFKTSIKHYINTHKIFLKLLNEGIIPIGDVSYKSMYEMALLDPDSIDDPSTMEEFKKKIQVAGETKYKLEAFDVGPLISDVQADIETFDAIYELICRITPKTDDKLQRLQSMLDSEYSDKKVLVFSEFATTARYLNKNIRWKGIKEQVDSHRRNPIQVARRFDPDNNPSSDPRPQKDKEISLLIATDVLAEGVNLQAGQVIINYDFHWNPTRLIQRAGRVDRIGSKNESVTVHNFLLDPKMEEDFGLECSVDGKINMIQSIIGEDYSILKEDERINTSDTYAIYRGDESILDKEEENQLDPSKFENILRDLQINNPKFWEELKCMPDGVRSSSTVKSGGRLILACERKTDRKNRIKKHYLIGSDGNVKEIRTQDALNLLESQDRAVHPTPSEYDTMVLAGWQKFMEDTEQMLARASSNDTLGRSQRWVIDRLLKIDSSKASPDQNRIIENLRKAYSVPITTRRLNRELGRIKKSGMGDADLINSLKQLYINYELKSAVKQDENESRSARILYSRYVNA